MKQKFLVVYYSRSGNTKKLAELTARLASAELFALIPINSYPAEESAAIAQAEKEIHRKFHPALQSLPLQLQSYDTVFVGTPNWWGTVAPPVTTFLTQCSLSGKRVAPFWTSGGGGTQHIAQDIATLCPGAALLQSFMSVNSDFTELQVMRWLQKIC